ncbi:glycosyltransferase family 2 protein [Mesorhizobium sediminum]|nr:glycosyltransferase family 2 protein [Mesorhizobium sediminum]
MAVYNGALYLAEQIETLARQDVEHIDLWFADDGSTDETGAIVERTRATWKKGEVHILPGPQKGFAENFRHLLVHPAISADYVALCDQDDLWDEDKLSTAIARLDVEASATPALHCSRTRIVAADGTPIGYSQRFDRPPSFQNAIAQNIAGGNTMVMNRAAHDLIRRLSQAVALVSHDWWCYLLVAGSGGKVFYSPDPKTSYRQHAQNLVGENVSLRARFSRLYHAGKGRYRAWNATNLSALETCREHLTEGRGEPSIYMLKQGTEAFSVVLSPSENRAYIARRCRARSPCMSPACLNECERQILFPKGLALARPTIRPSLNETLSSARLQSSALSHLVSGPQLSETEPLMPQPPRS